MFLILGIPMSWHKAALSHQVEWIGWQISVSTWTVSVPAQKLQRIHDQLTSISRSTKVVIKDLQSLVGRLLWLISLAFPPTIAYTIVQGSSQNTIDHDWNGPHHVRSVAAFA